MYLGNRIAADCGGDDVPSMAERVEEVHVLCEIIACRREGGGGQNRSRQQQHSRKLYINKLPAERVNFYPSIDRAALRPVATSRREIEREREMAR